MCHNVKGEKFVNFPRNDFKYWRSFVEGAHKDRTLSYPKNTISLFINYLILNKYILPQVKFEVWNNVGNTVRFYWEE